MKKETLIEMASNQKISKEINFGLVATVTQVEEDTEAVSIQGAGELSSRTSFSLFIEIGNSLFKHILKEGEEFLAPEDEIEAMALMGALDAYDKTVRKFRKNSNQRKEKKEEKEQWPSKNQVN